MGSRLVSVITVVMGFLILGVLGSTGNATLNSTVSVGNLTVQVSREQCGISKQCVEVPESCDPAASSACLFVSTRSAASQRTTSVAFQLRGDTEDNTYIAVGLSTSNNTGGNGSVYACAREGSSVVFVTAKLDNDTLYMTKLPVKSVLGSVTGNVTQCTFTAENLNATRIRAADTSFYVFLANGRIEGGTLGKPVIRGMTNTSLDLINPGGNSSTMTTPTPTTTGGTTPLQHVSQILLVLLSVLLLSA
ncbi:hypothetical protein JZ751_021822 [Albula glossodonta]|uniref:Ferric-chelate reductase 1 n=1 Tax=Albula glossodonta TaxID=121402 RepID=A0A8T2MUJ2_9TELE|nr:hypothetical protein JZ751_021818 [Albula glossodonta]KAG9330880.1 hypothetical protein JZ751_021822 [Albula glossodonta]